MKKNEIVIEVCIPHQMPAKAYIYANREEFSDAMIEQAHEDINRRWEKWTKQSAEDCYGADEVPADLAEALAKHGTVIERNGQYLSVDDAGLEVDWAIETNGYDYNSHIILDGEAAIAYALSGPEGHQKLRARRLVKELLMAELDKAEWPAEWRIDAIMDEMAETKELEEGEAMYYDKATGEIEIGKDGCQNAGTVCLRVGPDNIGNLDFGEIRSAIGDWIIKDREELD